MYIRFCSQWSSAPNPCALLTCWCSFLPHPSPLCFHLCIHKSRFCVWQKKNAMFLPFLPLLFPSHPLLLYLFHLSTSISIMCMNENLKYLSFWISITFLYIFMYLFVFIYSKTYPWLSWHSLHRWVWSWTNRDLSTSAPWILGLKVSHYA